MANKVISTVKKKTTNTLAIMWGFIAWVTGVLVSLAVGFGMIKGILYVPYIPYSIMMLSGWFVVILTIIGAILAIIDKIRG